MINKIFKRSRVMGTRNKKKKTQQKKTQNEQIMNKRGTIHDKKHIIQKTVVKRRKKRKGRKDYEKHNDAKWARNKKAPQVIDPAAGVAHSQCA